MVAETYTPAGREYIGRWSRGDDGVRHSADDRALIGDPMPVQAAVNSGVHYEGVTYYFPGHTYAASSDPVMNADLSEDTLFVRGDTVEQQVAVYPFLRKVLYEKDTVEMDHQVWMVWLKGLE
jgi:hypothetical protein